MKGDLHTLKRICEYASTAMSVGEIVIALFLIGACVLAVTSQFSSDAADIMKTVTGLSKPCDVSTWASFLQIAVILVMGVVTVRTIKILMISVRDEHSPFNDANTDHLILLSKFYLACSIVLGMVTALSSQALAVTLFMFFGCILIAVVLYCFGLIIRYGAVLQDESDHTL